MRMRTEKVSLKLGQTGFPIELSFTPEEMQAIDTARGSKPKTRFIREIAVESAKVRIQATGDVAALVNAAAEDCRMTRSEWLRVIVLGSIGFCPLAHYIYSGAQAHEREKRGAA